MAEMYKNKKNGQVAEYVEENDKAKTVTLKKEDGSFTAVSISTFKRWWVKVGNEEEKETPETETIEQEKQVVENTESKDEMVEQKEVKEEKRSRKSKNEKVEKPKKEKKTVEVNENVPEIQNYILSVVSGFQAEVFTPEKAKSVSAFKVGGHMFARMNSCKKHVMLCVRSKVGEISKPDKEINHLFDYGYIFTELNDENKKLIQDLLQASYDYQLNKNNFSEEKKQKKSKKVKEEE